MALVGGKERKKGEGGEGEREREGGGAVFHTIFEKCAPEIQQRGYRMCTSVCKDRYCSLGRRSHFSKVNKTLAM